MFEWLNIVILWLQLMNSQHWTIYRERLPWYNVVWIPSTRTPPIRIPSQNSIRRFGFRLSFFWLTSVVLGNVNTSSKFDLYNYSKLPSKDWTFGTAFFKAGSVLICLRSRVRTHKSNSLLYLFVTCATHRHIELVAWSTKRSKSLHSC